MPRSTKPTKRLTEKQRRFVEEYLVDLNATQAAIRAGYSEKTARAQGYENLTKPDIAAAIEKAQARLARRTDITQERVLQELARIGFSDMADFLSWGPKGVELTASDGLTRDQSACVSEVSETVTQFGGSTRIKLHSKTRALELLGRHLGLYPAQRHEVSGPDGGDIPVETRNAVLERLLMEIAGEGRADGLPNLTQEKIGE
ncbi:terminase small subunit [Desulfobaculum sp.]